MDLFISGRLVRGHILGVLDVRDLFEQDEAILAFEAAILQGALLMR